jgi:hypothetical protein
MKFIDYCRSCYSRGCVGTPGIVAPFIVDRAFNMKPARTTSLYGTLPNQVNYFPCQTLTCVSCGFVGVNIMYDDEEMSRIYTNYRDEKYNALRRIHEPTYDHTIFKNRHAYVDTVTTPFIQEGVSTDIQTLIDFGGYDGLNTPYIGKERYIYDVCDKETRVVSKIDTLFNCDLMTCMHVLEHIPDPNTILDEIKGKAKYYYFEVPKENPLHKEFWHEHINCFTMKSLTQLLSRHFNVLKTQENIYLNVLCDDI